MNVLKHIALVAATALVPAFAFAQTSTTPATPAPAASTPAPATTMPATPTTKPAHAHKRGERFKAADKDGDGALSKAEVDSAKMTRTAKNFDAIDSNKDGKITREEMVAYRTAHKGEHKSRKAATPATPAAPAAPAAATPATPAK